MFSNKTNNLLSTVDRLTSRINVFNSLIDTMANRFLFKGTARADVHCPYTEFQCWYDSSCPPFPYPSGQQRRCKKRECDPCYNSPACGPWSSTWCYPG
jgi:hypothetical protein